MSKWTIYDKSGKVLHESIEKFDGKGKAVEQDTLEYSGKWMGDCFITVSFKSAYPIDFQIGDYIMYRGEKFTINYDPTVIKKSSRGTYGEGFTYDSVKFNALSNELTDAKFHDWVLSDNKIHYSSLPNFSFYAKDMNDLADRLQACTDKWCKDNGFAKENYWIFYTPGSGGDTNPYDRTIQRAKDISTDSTFIQNVLTRWKQIYGDGGTLVARDDERLDKSISVSNQTVWQGMAMFKSQFGLNFIVRGREVIVGSAGVLSSHIFQYGKNKGLYEVQKQADTDQKVVTRLHAYGSSDNLPTRYYAELDMKVSASVTDVDKEKDYMHLTLDMPFKPSMYTQKLSKYGDNIYAIRLTLDGTEINARVEGGDDKGKVKIYSEYLEASEDPDDNTDKNTYDAFYNSVKAGSKVYITGGVNKDLAPAGSIDYSMNALPNNMAVMNLMLPGFPKYALSDICKSEYDTNTDTTSYYIRKSKDSSEWVLFHSEQGKHVVRFSSDQYDPYIVSQNADVLGYKDDDIFCTEENDDNGLKKVYPSVEEVTEAEAGVSSSEDYINTIVSADIIKDNGVFSSKTGTTIPGFQVKIKNLGFNLQDAIAAAGGDGCKLSMKDGHCGGRDFDVPSVSKNNDGTWTLNCKRSPDSSLDLYYPYSYNASIGGTPNATESYQICSGDHYVLTGIALEDTNYVWAASVKLLRKAIHWLCKNDYSRYTYSPKIDEIYMARQDEEAKASGGKTKSLHDTLKEGDLLWFKDEDLLLDGKVYIDQLVIKENGNNGIPTYDVTLRNEVQVGTIQRIQNKVDSISNDIRNGNVGGGVNPSTVENIATTVGDTRYLRKDQDDETTHKLTMGKAAVKKDLTVGGHVLTDDIHSYDSDGSTAMTGRGWVLKNVTDESGTYSVLAVDNIVVRKKMEAAELEIHKKTYVGAQKIASDWGHKILRVDPVDYNAQTGEITSIGMTLFTLPVTIDGVKRMVAFVGRQLSDTETRVELLGDGKGILNRELETTANAFKVYFCESDGTASIEDDLVVGTMGQCQEFNVKERVTHNFTNSYYWGVCLAHGVDEDVRIGDKSVPCVWGVFSHSTDLLTLTSEVSGKTFSCYGMEQSRCTFPVAGDDMVGFGCADPWQDTDRCNAIITASKDGENSAPSVISYSGIGRKRGGSVIGTLGTSATPPAYLNIGEQYSIPSDKADSRLDFRISKKAGNVFKGDLYFRGDDGTQHVNESLSNMTGNYNKLEARVKNAENGITSNTQLITETADKYKRQLTQETKDREGAVTSLQSNIDMTAGKLSTEISDRKESENGINASVSRIEQKANTIKEDITNGLKSVGFKMDGATWSVSTWGDRFSWYATKDDADSNDTSKAVMYLDSTTNTLNVKGSVTANLFYGKTKEVAFSESMSSYTIDPQKEPATTYFVDNHYRYESNFFILPKASDYDGLEISIFCKRTFTESRMSLDAFKVFVKCANTSDHFYVKKNFANVLKSGASSLNDFQHEVTVEDKGINYTDFIGDSVMIQQNSLVKFKSIGGAWYAIEGIFYGE